MLTSNIYARIYASNFVLRVEIPPPNNFIYLRKS